MNQHTSYSWREVSDSKYWSIYTLSSYIDCGYFLTIGFIRAKLNKTDVQTVTELSKLERDWQNLVTKELHFLKLHYLWFYHRLSQFSVANFRNQRHTYFFLHFVVSGDHWVYALRLTFPKNKNKNVHRKQSWYDVKKLKKDLITFEIMANLEKYYRQDLKYSR